VRLRNIDRLIFASVYRLFPSILDAVVVVKPETVIRWHRRGFQAYWHWKSRRLGGRPKLDREIRDLIRRMNRENPLWGAPRIHGELQMLGIVVAEATVSRYMVRTGRPPSQGWKTFLRNHAAGIASVDLFVVHTISFKLLYGLVILRHGRRKLARIGVTSNPTAEWIANQLTEAFPWDEAPQHLIRDRDGAYGSSYIRRVHAMGIRDHPTAPRSPWQNGHVERLIGSIRRDCLDHFVVFGEAHLRRVLKAYASYYNEVRTHLSLNKDAPDFRRAQPFGLIAALPVMGGLHHQYVRV
jgi:transposase InsO family protein